MHQHTPDPSYFHTSIGNTLPSQNTCQMTEATVAPYSLKVHIERGEDLPIADYTTSDPYVVVLLNDSEVGRTHTIFKNHLTPFWDKTFQDIPVYSIEDTELLLRVYDEDQRKSDDIMGIIRVGLLSGLPINSLRNDRIVKIQPRPATDEKEAPLTISKSLHPWGRDSRLSDFIDNLDSKHKWATSEHIVNVLSDYSPLLHNVTGIQNLLDDMLSDISSLLQPLAFSNPLEDEFDIDTSSFTIRTSKRLVCSSLVEYQNYAPVKYSRDLPMPFMGLRINLRTKYKNTDRGMTIAIDVGNKYVLWTFYRWLNMAILCWGGSRDVDAKEFRALFPDFHINATVSTSTEYALADHAIASAISTSALVGLVRPVAHNPHDKETWTGAVSFHIDSPFLLSVVDITNKNLLATFDFKDLISIQIAVDSAKPMKYGLILEVTSTDYQDNADLETRPTATNTLNDEDFGPKGVIGFRRFVRKTAYRASTAITSSAGIVTSTARDVATGAVSTAGMVATGTAKTIVTTAVDAAKTIATATTDPALVLSSAPRTVLGYGKDIFNFVASGGVILHGLFDHPVSYIVIKHRRNSFYALVPHNTSLLWDSRIVLDIDDDFIAGCMQSFTEAEEYVDVYLYHGIIGSEQLISQKCYKLSKILSKILPANNIFDLKDGFRMTSSLMPAHSETKITLNSEVGLYLSILGGDGMMVPQHLKVGGMFVKCKLADMQCKSVIPSSQNADVYLTKSVTSKTNPDWGGEEIFIKAKDGLDRATFVRLQILGGLPMNPDILGYVFIPLEDFLPKLEMRTYHVVKYKKLTGTGGSLGKYGLGVLRVKIQRIIDKSFNTQNASRSSLRESLSSNSGISMSQPTIRMNSALSSNSIYHSMYPGDVMLSGTLGSFNAPGLTCPLQMGHLPNAAESVFLSVHSADSLHILDVDSITALRENVDNSTGGISNTTDKDSLRESVVASTASSSAVPNTLHEADIHAAHHYNNANVNTSKELVEFAVFENQRRQILPPYDWSNGNLLVRVERGQYSDESGSRSFAVDSLAAIVPPSGYEWLSRGSGTSEWKVDKIYTPTDDFGWTYGLHFVEIMNNLSNGISSTSPALKCVRRRKWTRTARLVSATLRAGGNSLASPHSSDRSFSENVVQLSERNSSVGHVNDLKTRLTRKNSLRIKANASDRWRQDDYQQKSLNAAPGMQAILATCQERSQPYAPIKIPWSQVTAISCVTPSILSVKLSIHRYFGLQMSEGVETNIPIYRKADIDVFVFNCPAEELKVVINERRLYEKFRLNVKDVIASGNTSVIDVSEEGKDDDNAPQTVQLSPAAETMAGIVDSCAELDNQVMEIYMQSPLSRSDSSNLSSPVLSRESTADSISGKSRLDESSKKLLVTLATRVLRLRLYGAALLAANLSSPGLCDDLHSSETEPFSEARVNSIVDADLALVDRVILDDDVETVHNRIEYLLDIAEARIRDAALCGWSRRHDQLFPILEIYANRYLFEMVNQLSKFFKLSNLTALKGLQGKLTLISTFSSHNDRLDHVLQHALTPYYSMDIEIKPKPYLTLFLAFGQLLSWYAVVLQQEMKRVVQNALTAWKKRDVTGNQVQYVYPLPWTPTREKGNSGLFRTMIPEDTTQFLSNFLDFARLRRENMAPSLVTSIKEVDSKVALSYASAFLDLAMVYWEEVSKKKWNYLIFVEMKNTKNSNEGQENGLTDNISSILEQSEWLCSVSNDCRRVIDEAMIDKELNKHQSSTSNATATDKELSATLARSYDVFGKTMTRSLEYISCMIFYEAIYTATHSSSHPVIDLLHDEFYIHWERDVQEAKNDDTSQGPGLLSRYLSKIYEALATRCDYLNGACYLQLLRICADKLSMRIFQLLKDLRQAKRRYQSGGVELLSLSKDVALASSLFKQLLIEAQIHQWEDTLLLSFQRVNQAMILLTSHSEGSSEFTNTLKSLSKVANGRPTEAKAIAEMINTCLFIRDSAYFRIFKASIAAKEGPEKPKARPSLIGGLLGNVFDHLGASHPATASATASTAAPKRHSFTASASNTAPTALNTGEVSEAGDVYDYIHQILQEIEAESNDDEEDANEDEDRLGLDEYIPMLCNPAIEQSPTGQSVVSPLVKIFQLSDLYLQARIRKDVHASRAPNTYLFNLQSYVLDSVYHTQGSDSLVDQAASNPSGRASIYNLYIPPSHGLASASKMFAVVSKIKVFNLFCLDVTKKPSTYISALVYSTDSNDNHLISPSHHRPNTCTSSVIYDSTDPDWTSEESMRVPMCDTHGVALSSSSATGILILRVMYKNRIYSDECMGWVEIPLLALDVAPITKMDYDLRIESDGASGKTYISSHVTGRVKAAYAQAKEDGLPTPKIRVSVAIATDLFP